MLTERIYNAAVRVLAGCARPEDAGLLTAWHPGEVMDAVLAAVRVAMWPGYGRECRG